MTPQPTFPKRVVGAVNWLVVTGIALPLMLVLLFLAAVNVPRWLVDPPTYDFLLAVNDPELNLPKNTSMTYAVEDGKLVVVYTGDAKRYTSSRRLYWWNADSQTADPVDLGALPDVGDDTVRFTPKSLESVRISQKSESPDGYRFEDGTGSRAGFFGGLFYTSRSGGGRVSKRGASYPVLPAQRSYRYWGPVFVGWVLDDG